tara:strand:- start:87 stop:641 length:555 start_codon:yes stop_codon:yes gene_type:complete
LLSAITKENTKENLLESQLKKHMNASILWLRDLYNIFPLGKYEPVFGPIEPIVKINKTPFSIHVSGLFRSKKNQTIHAIIFSPYSKKHSIINDPIPQIVVKILKPFVKRHLQSMRPQVILHVFAIGHSNELLYHKLSSNDINKNTMHLLTSLVSSMEEGFHYPIVPCPYSCQYKANCFPGVKDE